LKEVTMRAVLLATCVSLAACVSAPPIKEPPPPPGSVGNPIRPAGECRAEPAQRLLGAKASVEVGDQLLALTGAQNLRWVPPRTAVTMDFRADRLTVSYDDDMVITRISCT
jgi:hypothetical protein